MLGNLFGKKEQIKEEILFAPITGSIVSLEKVPDPVFSQKMMGDGIAFEPNEGQVVAPIDGEIIQLFHTKHAIGIRSKGNLEILIHIGLETVSMNGEGFTAHVKEGDKIKTGDLLISFDLNLVKEKASSTITPMVITNGEKVKNMENLNAQNTTKGQTEVLKITLA